MLKELLSEKQGGCSKGSGKTWTVPSGGSVFIIVHAHYVVKDQETQ